MLIAQFSDLHLRPVGQLYKGRADSNAMFAAALRQLDQLDVAPDLVLLSGDLVDEGSAAEYATVRHLLQTVRPPVVAIPGNHDDPAGFRACFAGNPHVAPHGPLHVVADEYGPVRIIGLDVTVSGHHHGDMDDAACAWLDARLREEPQRPTIIMLHQPPFDSGIPYIDVYKCRRGERLAAIVSRHPQVERILCGHIHRAMLLRFGGTLLQTAPSTTTAIALRLAPDAEPASFIEPPAFLLHHWRPGTGLVSHTVPIGAFPGPFPFY